MPTDPPHDQPPSPPAFDLTERPWLRALRLDGTEIDLSLREVFHQAPGLLRLVGDLPTQEFALFRLLLAILHDAVDGPVELGDWEELWEAEALPVQETDRYLDRYQERFDLFHPETPFFQVAGLHTEKGEYASLDRVVADVPNGERFFTMRALGARTLTFAEAARWLVHTQAFDTSGIKSGVVGDPRAKGGKAYPQGVAWAGNIGGTMWQGANLKESLLLNLIATDYEHIEADDRDAPAWRHEPTGPGPIKPSEAVARPHGVRDLYTWQSRRVRLFADADRVHGVLLTYGDPLAPHEDRHLQEPMTGWRRSQTQEKKHKRPLVLMPREHDPTRSAWRGLASLLTESGHRNDGGERPRILDWVARLRNDELLREDHRRLRLRLIGAQYGTQQSVIDEVVDDDLDMTVALLDDQRPGLRRTAIGAVSDADAAVCILATLAHDLAEAGGAEPKSRCETARDRAYGRLDRHYRQWLSGLGADSDPDGVRDQWRRTLRREIERLGRELARNAGPTAWRGRIVGTATGSLWLGTSQARSRFERALKRKLPINTAEPAPPSTS